MERRLKSRHEIPMKAIVSFTSTTSHEYKTLNVSGDGAFLITDKAKPVGTRVLMSLLMDTRPDNLTKKRKVITIRGTVKHLNQHGMAICFDQRLHFAGMGPEAWQLGSNL